jgi:pimeloyl-ACP methyl ester carboxylesterase
VQLHAVGGIQDGSPVWPVLPWRSLRRDSYRAALRSGTLRCGVYLEEPLHRGQPTVVFIHGAGGAPNQFATLAGALDGRVNRAIFLWDDTARLAPAAERLRAAVLRPDDAVAIVAHSMGTLLPAYIGATDPQGCLRGLAVTYLNPLVGGSRHAGDFRALRWLGSDACSSGRWCVPVSSISHRRASSSKPSVG